MRSFKTLTTSLRAPKINLSNLAFSLVGTSRFLDLTLDDLNDLDESHLLLNVVTVNSYNKRDFHTVVKTEKQTWRWLLKTPEDLHIF